MEGKVTAEESKRYNAGYSKLVYEKSQTARDERIVQHHIKQKHHGRKETYVTIELCDITTAINTIRIATNEDK